MKYDAKEYWENIWTTKKSNEVSWYQEEPKTSTELILSTNPSKDVKDGGYLIISSFSTKGPKMCSGLDTRQYSEESMKKLFSNGFEYIKGFEEEHVTPRGIIQIFTYNVFRKRIPNW